MDKKRDTNDEIRTTSQNGQVAVILILVTAMALIYYAVSLNFGRMSQVKTLITLASDTSAAQLASGIASYGQAQSKTSLEGRRRVCAYTGIFATILAIVIIVIAIATGQLELIGWGGAILALSAVALTVQATVIQPGISDAWSRYISLMPSPKDQMIEGAIQSALRTAVTDTELVPDLYDLDGDRVWEENPGNVPPADAISRFSVYNTERLKGMEGGILEDIDDFITALRNLLYAKEAAGVDSWGLYDPYRDAGPGCFTAECDYCCIPDGVVVDGEAITRPEDCDPAFDWQMDCGNRSPYGAGYPWVYDPYFEDAFNGIFSFREQLGRDDEHQLFEKVLADPNGIQIRNALAAPPLPPAPWNFLLRDTTSYYFPVDNKRGVFPFFYKVVDWGLDLDELQIGIISEHCYWSADAWDGGLCPMGALPAELNVQPLVLPRDPATLTYNRNAYVDSVSDNTAGEPSLAPDKVSFPDYIIENDLSDLDGNPPLDSDPRCAQRALFDTAGVTGFWKRGGDRFCSINWPYFAICPKNNPGTCFEDGLPVDCECEPLPNVNGTRPAEFPDDVLDDFVYGLSDFIDWAEELLARPVADLSDDFINWYPQAAAWIEPGTAAPPTGSNAIVNGVGAGILSCFSQTCRPEDGYLHTWRKELDMVIDRLERWKTISYQGSGANACSEVWCAPPVGCFLDTPSTETPTFDSNGNGIRGDINDVIACLDYNVNYTVGTAVGNAQRFQACYDACTDCVNNDNCAGVDAACDDPAGLPRSLVPGFSPNTLYGGPQGALVSDLNNCRNQCTTCDNGCAATRDACIIACAGNGACIGACNDAYGACYDVCNCTAPLTGVLDCSSTDFTALINSAKGACTNSFFMGDGLPAAPNGLLESIPEAQNQVEKFRQRLIFLQSRLRELNRMIGLSDDWDATNDDDLLFACLETCSNANCQAMPLQYFQAPLNPFGPGDPSVVDFDATQCAGWGQGNLWYDAVSDALGILTVAFKKLAAFLDGPAADLIQQRIQYAGADDTGLPYYAIYGWMSDPPPGDTLGRGRWHIVKVEARMPGKCDNACNTAQDPDPTIGDPAWPWIRTYTKNWGTKRCYELTSTDGVVKFRTIRFDENRGSSVLFPNGVPLWEFKYFHPQRPVDYEGAGDSYAQTLDNLGNLALCGSSMIDQLPLGAPDGTPDAIYAGAFMLNKPEDNIVCWSAVHNLLTRGVVSERCAQYYWHEGTNHGMGFKFVPCFNF